jgi:hypothetical protein
MSADAVARLSEVGMTLSRHVLPEVKHTRAQMSLVESTGVLVTFTGSTTNRDVTDPQGLVLVRLNATSLPRLITGLDGLLAGTTDSVRLPAFTEPNTMSLLGPIGGITLTTRGATWERTIFGHYTAPLTPDHLRDLRDCLRTEHALLTLSGEGAFRPR